MEGLVLNSCWPLKGTGVLVYLLFLSMIGSLCLGSSNIGSIKATGRVTFIGSVEALREIVLVGGNITVKYMEERMGDYLDRFMNFGICREENKQCGLIRSYHHAYVVFGFSHPVRGDMIWIKAEKGGNTGKSTADAGIQIFQELTEPRNGTVRYELRDFRLCSGREMWSVGEVLDIFAAHDPDYNLFTANCWLFSVKSTEAILNWLISNALDRCTEVDLERELEKLKTAERTMPNVRFKSFFDPRDNIHQLPL